MRPLVLVPVLLAAAPCLWAHPGHGAGFAAGAAHPWLGLDHLLAMVAVGVLAMRAGGNARWLLPALFLVAMAAGAALGAAGVALPGVEPAIAGSLIAFGLLLAAGVRRLLPLVLLVAVFAIPHGHAHLVEAPADGGLAYAAGMLLATAVLHALGLLAAWAGGRLPTAQPWRWAGGGLAVAGLAMLALRLS